MSLIQNFMIVAPSLTILIGSMGHFLFTGVPDCGWMSFAIGAIPAFAVASTMQFMPIDGGNLPPPHLN